jgi:putative tricarboxylic transport membrane protein
MAGDPYKVVFGTSNAWNQPMVSKVAFKHTDLTPIAAMVQDEFLLWVKQDAPYQNVTDYLKAVAAKPGDFKMGGAQSKDTDEVLTRLIDKTAKVKFTYIPFKSGAEAAVQLAGGHIDSHINNPSESIGQWKGSTQRPLCAFSQQRLPDGPKVTSTQNWHDIPAAAHGLAARKSDGGTGGVLCRPDAKSSGHAGMEGIYRAVLADRHLPHRRRAQQIHRGGHGAHP